MRPDISRAVHESTIDVPGGRLRFFVRGTGPLLALVAGGHSDASRVATLAGHLAGRYTVVTYDRRGLSGSTPSDPATTITTHADDLSRLLRTLTREPALVYGTSFGSLIALELAARSPEQVGTLVAHEPGAARLLPEDDRLAAVRGVLAVEETYRTAGAAAAMRRFAAQLDIDPADAEPDVESTAPWPERMPNAAYLIAHDLPLLRSHVVDLAALRDSPARIVAGVGASSAHLWPNRCGRLLAAALGIACETFPGGHNGYLFRPRATAARLEEVLEEALDEVLDEVLDARTAGGPREERMRGGRVS